MSFLKEFKEFAMKGNVVDLAVGVVIGAAFGKIVTSLVNDIMMPLVTLITGKIPFDDLFIQLDYSKGVIHKLSAAKAEGISTLNYGTFISNVIDFLIVAFCIFIVIRQINRLKPKCEPAPVTTKECPFCKTTIHIDAARCPNCTSELEKQH